MISFPTLIHFASGFDLKCMWNQTEIIERPNWTKATVTKLLGKPDKIEQWTYGRKSGTKNLYEIKRVLAAESSSAFAAII